MPGLVIRGANVLHSAASPTAETADILIRDGRIVAVGTDVDAAGCELLDAAGQLVIPGLINAHLHSPGNFMRGTLEGLPLEVFMLYEVPHRSEGSEDPERVRLRTLLGAAEMLKLGITSVADDVFFVPLTSRSAIDVVAAAYVESGMRATIGLDQPIVVEYEKFPFLADLLPDDIKRRMEDVPRETADGMLAHYDHLIDTWDGAGEGRIAAAVSCSAPQRATPVYLKALSTLARAYDLPFFCHVLETKLQRVLGEEKYGQSLIRYIDDLGILDEHMQVIHAIRVDDEDIAILGRSGAVVAHNPVCNMRLGSGVMPFRALRNARVPLCLGTDEAISDDSHNLWIAMKTAGMIHALADPDFDAWPKAEEILSAVWDGGDRLLRRPVPLGRIEPGAAADLAILDLDAPAFRPLHDIRRQLVLCETGSSVVHTIVAGEIVMRDRKLTTIDENELLAELRALEPRLREEAKSLQGSAATVLPYYRQMVEMAAARDVGFSRWVGR